MTKAKAVSEFGKEQILSSKKFSTIEKDVLRGILEDKEYTLEEAKKALDEFKKVKYQEEDKEEVVEVKEEVK